MFDFSATDATVNDIDFFDGRHPKSDEGMPLVKSEQTKDFHFSKSPA